MLADRNAVTIQPTTPSVTPPAVVAAAAPAKGDGLLANLQERLIKTDSGVAIVNTTSLSSNTDLKTLADLATMGDKTSTANGQDSREQQLAESQSASTLSSSSQENIVRALDR